MSAPLLPICKVSQYGTISYKEAINLQKTLVTKRLEEKIPDQLILLEHPPVITKGGGSKDCHILTPADILTQNGIEISDSPRGGGVTLHLPGQLIGYPILLLRQEEQNLRGYLRRLEEVIIRTLIDFGIKGERHESYTGVWVGKNKIAALGIHCWKRVTSHGFAMNINPNLEMFKHIVPCGIKDKWVTSMSQEVNEKNGFITLNRTIIEQKIIKYFGEVFNRAMTFAEEFSCAF